MKFQLKHWHKIALIMVVYDILSITASYFFALFCRFDFQYSAMMAQFGRAFFTFIPIYVAGSVLIYYAYRLYNSIWRFSSVFELVRISAANLICLGFAMVLSFCFTGRLPVAVFLIGGIFQYACAILLRFAFRFVLLMRGTRVNAVPRKRAMLIGAGRAGQMILHDSRNPESGLEVVCVIDDNPNKFNRTIDGVKVIGGRESIAEAAEKYNIETILVAVPSASSQERKEILNLCQETGIHTQVLPSLIQMANGNMNSVLLSDMKNIEMEDLLGRDPIRVDMEEILSSLTNKVILVTGGGGSIGSELCRQIASHLPKQLIIFDIYENNAYDIQNELKNKYPNLDLRVLIGSVRDTRRVNSVFETFHPQIVYHAAAHKHVPLMENAPCESIKNNVFGTYKCAKAALEYGAEKFVLISTDKAVHPTNIMGASKRLCEMVIQTFNDISMGKVDSQLPNLGTCSELHISSTPRRYKTQYVAVRFGNVLGSNGSVIPMFKKQIEHGGPVTVTHPEITRYFMTIPEAVSLVLQAGTYARGGEIFVLDMGEPVKIDDLARKLIRLSGHTPNGDIKIEYTGLRPGEKLYEEKLMAEEGLEKTENDLIHIGKPLDFDREEFLASLGNLYRLAMRNDASSLILEVSRMVKTYKPDWNNFENNHIISRYDFIPYSQQDFSWEDLEFTQENSMNPNPKHFS